MQDPESDRGYRPEIQGLRALAVLLVVGYHLSPTRLSGGYVGVDVFFVISGYLITAHLHREVETTGRLRLGRFWARRARRLLPASLLVLGCSAVFMAIVLPTTLWDQTIRQITASALYWQNWALAADAVDYSARGNSPTLVQHYWSLSLEEQIYLVWPLVLAGLVVLFRRRGATAVRRAVLAGVALLAATSFVWSVVLTQRAPGTAYFATQTRVWEFAAGALLALLGTGLLRATWLRTALGWGGLLAVAWSGWTFGDRTPFPGWVALVPVLGTIAVIAAGPSSQPWTAAYWLSLRPARFVGDLSYSVYLWHWPLLVGLPYVTGEELAAREKVGVLVATLLVAWASTRLVEDPARRSRFLAQLPWRPLVAAGLAMALVVGGVQLLQLDLDRQVSEARDRADRVLASVTVKGCDGPPALDPGNRCDSPSGAGRPVSPPGIVARQNTEVAYPGCESDQTDPRIERCELGDTTSPTRTVALVGDSHAFMWFSAFDRLAERAHWKVVTYSRSSCPFTLARRTLPSEAVDTFQRLCENANDIVLDRLVADTSIDTVFVAAFSSAYGWTSAPGRALADPAVDGFHRAWAPLVRAGKQVVVLRDVPGVKDLVNTPDCLARHPDDATACANPRARALTTDLQAVAARRGAPRGVRLLDLTDQFCDSRWCYAVVGDVIVYRDYSHLSDEYSALLAPYLSRAFARVDVRGDRD